MADDPTIPVADLPVPPVLRAYAGVGSHAVEVVRPISKSTVDAAIAAVTPLIAPKADQASLDAAVALLKRRILVNAHVFG